MSDNVVPLRGPVIAEWNVKMRMIFVQDGGRSIEFELPEMGMTPNYVDEMVDAFRDAVLKATRKP